MLSLISTTDVLTAEYIDSNVVSRSLTEPSTELGIPLLIVPVVVIVPPDTFAVEVDVVDELTNAQPANVLTIINVDKIIISFFFILVTPFIIFRGYSGPAPLINIDFNRSHRISFAPFKITCYVLKSYKFQNPSVT